MHTVKEEDRCSSLLGKLENDHNFNVSGSIREILQYVITCQNTYVLCRQAQRKVLVLLHFAALWLDVKAKNRGCGLSTFLQTTKSLRFPSPCSKIEKARVTPNHKTAKVKKNWLRRKTVARPGFTWLTYQDTVILEIFVSN